MNHLGRQQKCGAFGALERGRCTERYVRHDDAVFPPTFPLFLSVVSLPISRGARANTFSVAFVYSPIPNTRAAVQNGSLSLGKLMLIRR